MKIEVCLLTQLSKIEREFLYQEEGLNNKFLWKIECHFASLQQNSKDPSSNQNSKDPSSNQNSKDPSSNQNSKGLSFYRFTRGNELLGVAGWDEKNQGIMISTPFLVEVERLRETLDLSSLQGISIEGEKEDVF